MGLSHINATILPAVNADTPVLLHAAAAIVVAAASLLIFILGLTVGYRMSRGMSPVGVPQWLRMGREQQKPSAKLPAING